jgi:hypothetical protein
MHAYAVPFENTDFEIVVALDDSAADTEQLSTPQGNGYAVDAVDSVPSGHVLLHALAFDWPKLPGDM